jgi:hypothetical protein
VPVIQKSAAYQSGQLVVFITWDEGEGADRAAGEHCWNSKHANKSLYPSCRVATLVLSSHTKPGTRSGSYFNHLGLLGTAEGLLDVPGSPPPADMPGRPVYLRASAAATGAASAWMS